MSSDELDRRLIATALGTVHAWHRPGDRGRLLLLHMSPRSGRMYHDVMARLDREVLAPDRPGFGHSDPPRHTPTMTDYARSALAVADDAGWDRFDVIGTHTGSVEAVEIARIAPERVRRLGLVSIPAYTPAEIEERLGGVAAPRPRPRTDGSHLTAMWRRRIEIRSSTDVDLDYLDALFVDELSSARHAHLAYRAVLAYPTLERLESLDVDAVVIAPRDDLAVQTDRSLERLGGAVDVVRLPHLDFDLWNSAPDEMAALIESRFSMERRSETC